LISLSPHRFYGPKGVGILYRARAARLESLVHGGSQEEGKRAGTENVPAIVGAGAACELASTEIAVRQAVETETATRFGAVTDVVNAYAAFDTNQKVVALYQSGYLDQAKQSLEITTYVYQHGAGTLLDLLDAERTYRATELAYRQALAAYMTSLRQLNFAVGKQVIP